MATGAAMMIKMDSPSSTRATPAENSQQATPQTPQSMPLEPAVTTDSAPTVSTADASSAGSSRFGWWGRHRRQRVEFQSSTPEAAQPSLGDQQVSANSAQADQAVTGNNSIEKPRFPEQWDRGHRFWRYGPQGKRGPREDFGGLEGGEPSHGSVEGGAEMPPSFGMMGNFRGPHGHPGCYRGHLFRRGGGAENGYFFREFDFIY